jgi:hypothetical protein
MLGSSVLEFILSISFIYFMFSIIASTILESINALRQVRAKALKANLAEFAGRNIRDGIYGHPLVCGLAPKDKQDPAYIPSETFALALIDTMWRQTNAAYLSQEPKVPGQGLPPTDVVSLRLVTSDLASALKAAEDKGQAASGQPPVPSRDGSGSGQAKTTEAERIERVVALVESCTYTVTSLSDVLKALAKWFDESMERMSGRYKRQTQIYLFGIGIVIAVAFNVNAIRVADQLWASASAQKIATAASGLAAQSGSKIPEVDTVLAKAANINFPIGWVPTRPVHPKPRDNNLKATVRKTAVTGGASQPDSTKPQESDAVARTTYLEDHYFNSYDDVRHSNDWQQWVLSVTGWLMTAFLISLGAPFWFDLLSKASNLRGVGTKPAKAQDPDPTASAGTT